MVFQHGLFVELDGFHIIGLVFIDGRFTGVELGQLDEILIASILVHFQCGIDYLHGLVELFHFDECSGFIVIIKDFGLQSNSLVVKLNSFFEFFGLVSLISFVFEFFSIIRLLFSFFFLFFLFRFFLFFGFFFLLLRLIFGRDIFPSLRGSVLVLVTSRIEAEHHLESILHLRILHVHLHHGGIGLDGLEFLEEGRILHVLGSFGVLH
jgi:hypothetical protein